MTALNLQTRRDGEVCDLEIALPSFVLQSGETLSRPHLSVRLHGDIRRPAMCVAGGISAGRAAADQRNTRGWWAGVVAPGGAVDLDRYCVIGFDFLPNGEEAARTITTHDQARALASALDALNVRRLRAFVGASYGGMVALAFAEQFPEQVERLCLISAADRSHPASTALRGVQRRIIEFAERHGAAAEGVSLARQLAMIAYRSADEFAERFAAAPGRAAGDPYDVCEYLISRGDAWRMDARRYVTLSDSIDRHRVDPAKITTPSLFLAAYSDRLVPADDIARVARAVRNGRLFRFESLYGHDAFLKEAATIGPVIKPFIEE